MLTILGWELVLKSVSASLSLKESKWNVYASFLGGGFFNQMQIWAKQ